MTDESALRSLWRATAPPAPPEQKLLGPVHVDVLVIGGGFTGVSAALHLAQGGAKVALVEAKAIGHGASGRNAGFVNAGMWVQPDEILARFGEDYGIRALRQLGAAPTMVFDLIRRHGIACEATPNGTLHCAVGEKGWAELQQREAQWRRFGADVELLSAEAAAARIGSPHFCGALLDRRCGTIQPLAYVRGLARAAAEAGAALFVHSPILGIEDLGDAWRARTAEGEVNASWVLVATNAYSDALWPELRRELVLIPYFNLATEPLDPSVQRAILPGREGAWDTRDVLTSIRWDKAGRLIIGSFGLAAGPGAAVHESWGRRTLSKLFPVLERVNFAHAWHGMIGLTADDMPRFHRLRRNIYTIGGFNGRGIAAGTTYGADLAALVLGQRKPEALSLPLTEPRPLAFRRGQEAFYGLGAALFHGLDARF